MFELKLRNELSLGVFRIKLVVMKNQRFSNLRGIACSLLVGIALASSAETYGALSSVEDSILAQNEIAGSNTFYGVYYLGHEGNAYRIFGRAYGAITDHKIEYRDSLETGYLYGPPTADEPGIATFAWQGGPTKTFRFGPGDSKVASEILSPYPTRLSFHTRESLTGALNVSNRIWLHPGENNITGTVIDEPSWILIRGIGPSLSQFDVENPVSDVSIALYHGEERIDSNDQWGTDGPDAQGMTWVFELAGAFLLEEGTNDAALFTRIEKGAITVHVTSGEATEAGEALVEVYILPYR